MTYQDALKIIKAITVYYQNFVITDEKVKEWALVIQEFEFDQVAARLKEHARTSKFPPVLADLIEQEAETPKAAAYVHATPDYMNMTAEEAQKMLIEIEGERFTNPAELPDFLKNRGTRR